MCQRSKGKGNEFRRETAREGEGRRGASPFLLPRVPFALPTHPYPLFLPFGRLDYLSNSGQKWNVFTCNIKIFVNSFPCFSLRLCYIYIYFFHVSVVWFNVTLKLSIKDIVLQYAQILSAIFPNK